MPGGATDALYSLVACEGRLISRHYSGQLRVWNVVTGMCEQVLEGKTPVYSLVTCGSRLVSGYVNKSIKVWAIGAAVPWTCERTLLGHTGAVWSLAG